MRKGNDLYRRENRIVSLKWTGWGEVELENQVGRVKEEAWKGGNMEGTAKIKGYLRGGMELYYSGNFFKYIHIWLKPKWSHQITGEAKFQLDISCQQMKLPVPRMVYNWTINQSAPCNKSSNTDDLKDYWSFFASF